MSVELDLLGTCDQCDKSPCVTVNLGSGLPVGGLLSGEGCCCYECLNDAIIDLELLQAAMVREKDGEGEGEEIDDVPWNLPPTKGR